MDSIMTIFNYVMEAINSIVEAVKAFFNSLGSLFEKPEGSADPQKGENEGGTVK